MKNILSHILLLIFLLLLSTGSYAITITSTLPNGSSDKDIPVEANKEYELNFDLDKQTTNTIRLVISEGTTILVDAPNLSASSNSFAFTTSSTTVNIKFQRLDTDNQTKTFAINNLSYTPHVSTQNHIIGLKEYEITDHLGNVRVVLSDKKNGIDAEVKSATDYLPFGMVASGRTFSNGYRYGFNGKEKLDELTEGMYDFDARLLDVRTGKWLAIDPKFAKYPYLSPYNFVANNPILFIDPNGEELWIGGVREKALTDVRSLVPEPYRMAIQVTEEGKIFLDASKIQTTSTSTQGVWDGNDAGTNLVQDLVKADEKYLYQVKEKVDEIRPRDGYKRTTDLTAPGENGVSNWSSTANEALSENEQIKWLENPKENAPKSVDYRPIEQKVGNFDGIVTVSPTAIFVDEGGIKPRETVVFHEMKENFERTTNKLPYDIKLFPVGSGNQILYKVPFDTDVINANSAHDIAKTAENSFHNASVQPGKSELSNGTQTTPQEPVKK